MSKRCRTCKYRSGESSANGCDYAIITGRTRTAQVTRPSQLQPSNCPFYEAGERQDRLSHINLEDRASTMERHNRQRLEAFDKAALMAAYSEGLNDHEIAERVGTTVNLVAYWRRQNELPRNKHVAKPKRFDAETFRKLYDDGMNDTEIGIKLGVAKDAIGYYRRSIGLPAHNFSNDVQVEKFLSLYNSGHSDAEISKALGVTKSVVYKYRFKHGLKSKYKSGGAKDDTDR